MSVKSNAPKLETAAEGENGRGGGGGGGGGGVRNRRKAEGGSWEWNSSGVGLRLELQQTRKLQSKKKVRVMRKLISREHCSFCPFQNFVYILNIYVWPWTTKPVISRTVIFAAIANNTLYGSKLWIILLCQKSLGYYVKITFHEYIL